VELAADPSPIKRLWQLAWAEFHLRQARNLRTPLAPLPKQSAFQVCINATIAPKRNEFERSLCVLA
jgi:hypothetical protein